MSKPQGVITAKEAIELSDQWTKLRKDANDRAAGKPDNRSSWYSLEEMETFIKMIKEENKSVNGIRFYLGVDKVSKLDQKGYTTIFMVPTEEINGGNHDIIGANGMDRAGNGNPPQSGCPQ
ncbi:hypothetical protein DZC78_01285 [Olleya aquimaris]|uniref:Uncharacterized protein n=1 Tax=Olleya sediminilitoris TaxID=2795739 RepID=A0ABS1WNT7_9FLAO|nr:MULTISPECIES: hypothetical protein [Olleya]AXO79070.1 hypothetical protein DZC78_01285 [Olleya aquimaris]MBL7560777.1 hypothetical protein [Olleya sediminilitoris]